MNGCLHPFLAFLLQRFAHQGHALRQVVKLAHAAVGGTAREGGGAGGSPP